MPKKLESEWSRRGRTAEARDLAEAGKLARAHRRKAASAEREARAMEVQSKRVGTAIRRVARQDQRRHLEWLTVSPKHRNGRNGGHRRLPRFEVMTGQGPIAASHVGADGLSSFHLQWHSRGLRPRKGQSKSHAYRRGEIVRLVKYILRDAAREIEGGGIVSSIGDDPDSIASVLGAVEELEMAAGQENANVYVSLVISLPHESAPEGRERVLTCIVEAFREEELPFAAVLHKPDPGTDQRNFHAHVVASLRPFRREKDGRYSFAALPSADLNDGEWIQPLRTRIAAAINEEMAQLEVKTGTRQRVFTALSHASRGLPPRSKAEGKTGPGAKAAERRAAEAEAGRIELARQQAHLHLLDQLAGLVTGLAAHVPANVTAIVEEARARVAQQSRKLATAVHARAIRARVAQLARTGRSQGSTPSRLLGRTFSAPGANERTSLANAPTLGTITPLGRVTTLAGIGSRRTGMSRASKGDGSTTPSLLTDPTLAPVVTVVPAPPASKESTSPSTRKSGHERSPSIHLGQALDLAANLPFLPLRPDKQKDGTTRCTVDIDRAVASDLDALRLIRDHEQDERVQRMLRSKYAIMQQVVPAELISEKTVRPSGDVRRMFDHDPRLASAVMAAWGHVSLISVVNEARSYWLGREAIAPEAASPSGTAAPSAAPMQEEADVLDELSLRMKRDRKPGR